MRQDFSRWSQAQKDQYNSEIRRRNEIEIRKLRLDEIENVSWSSMNLTEETVFSMLAYFFPVDHLILKIIRQSLGEEADKSLLLSWKQIHQMKHVFTGYYSDREKVILMLNHYVHCQDLKKVFEVLSYLENQEENRFAKVIIGVILLDAYLGDLKSTGLLDKTVAVFENVRALMSTQKSHTILDSLLAFCFYMKKDFAKSRSLLLVTSEPRTFQAKFRILVSEAA